MIVILLVVIIPVLIMILTQLMEGRPVYPSCGRSGGGERRRQAIPALSSHRTLYVSFSPSRSPSSSLPVPSLSLFLSASSFPFLLFLSSSLPLFLSSSLPLFLSSSLPLFLSSSLPLFLSPSPSPSPRVRKPGRPILSLYSDVAQDPLAPRTSFSKTPVWYSPVGFYQELYNHPHPHLHYDSSKGVPSRFHYVL